MIRPFTCLCLAAACGSGLYLYSEKHRAVLLDREITSVVNQTQAARARVGLLRAEWALSNEPGRLQGLADKYLALKPMVPIQFVQLADLAAHLPAPQTAAEAQSAQSLEDADTADGHAAPPPDTGAVVADTGADVVLPKHVLESRQGAPVAAKLLARLETKTRRVVLADRAYTPPAGALARGAPLPLAAPQPTVHLFSAMAHTMPQPAAHAQIVSAVPHYAPPYVGSALGGRGSLPPPVPYGGVP